MSQPVDLITAWAERDRLYWLDDEQLETAVAKARHILASLALRNREADFVAIMAAALSRDPDPLEGEPVEAAARALLYLAQHGIPHVSPTAH